MATTDRWKYLVVTLTASVREIFCSGVSDERMQAELDQHGMLGWELVQVTRDWTTCRLVFKRPA